MNDVEIVTVVMIDTLSGVDREHWELVLSMCCVSPHFTNAANMPRKAVKDQRFVDDADF